jgi:hypothetical protein
MKKQYVYIGQYYHIKNKDLPLDFKFGVTENLNQRENSLSKTKSPIKYMILKAWEIPYNAKREKVEKLISTIFSENKYDGCEWYDIDYETFQGKISTLFQIITEMVEDCEFKFSEVDLSKGDSEDTLTNEIEKEIRNGKKTEWTNLEIKIDGVSFSGKSARDGFVNAIKKVVYLVGDLQFLIDNAKLSKSNIEDFPEYKRGQVEKINNFYLDTHSSTKDKCRILTEIFKKYNISYQIDIV